MQSTQDYSPSNCYPNYVGWQVVLSQPDFKALNCKQAVHPPVHHR